MIRRLLYGAALAAAVPIGMLIVLLGQAGPAGADNCSGLQDCYGSARSAASAVAGITVLLGASVLLAPRLLRRDAPPPERRDGSHGAPPVVPPPGESDHEHREEHREYEAVEPPELQRPLRFDEMVRADMAVRGWTERAVDDLTRRPAWFQRATDTRHNQDGSRDDAPAVVFGTPAGSYVVVNLLLGDVVHVGNMPVPVRRPSWDAPETLPARVAWDTAAASVLTDGREFFYPAGDAIRAVEYCGLNRIRVLGMAGFTPRGDGLTVQPDMILDCSAERNAEESGEADPVAPAVEAARRLLYAWRATPGLYVSLTVSI